MAAPIMPIPRTAAASRNYNDYNTALHATPATTLDINTVSRSATGSKRQKLNSTGPSKRGVRETTKLFSRLFDTVAAQEGRKTVMRSKCVFSECGQLVPAANIGRRFHVMNCRFHSDATRLMFDEASIANDKPPMLRDPLVGIFYREARRRGRQMKDNAVEALATDLVNPSLWKGDRIFNTFLKDKNQLPKNGRVNEVTLLEQELFNIILTRMIVDEKLPFSTVDKKNTWSGPFWMLMRFARKGLVVPSST